MLCCVQRPSPHPTPAWALWWSGEEGMWNGCCEKGKVSERNREDLGFCMGLCRESLAVRD